MEGPMIIEAEMEGHFVHRMANIATGDDRRRGTLNFRLEEFHGGKITISLQWNYKKARGKEDPGNPIYGPWNDKIPSGWRNSYVAEQQDHPARVHDGFRTRGAAACSTLTEEGRKELCGLLRRNLDIFARKPTDMTGVSRYIAEHRLNIREGCLPVRQKKMG
ncbi:hypothetical protein Tco_0135337, partial [Tanacetum coccineum]